MLGGENSSQLSRTVFLTLITQGGTEEVKQRLRIIDMIYQMRFIPKKNDA